MADVATVLFTKFLKKQIKLKIIEIPGSGNYSIQPISINDVVKVFFQSLDHIKFKNKIIDLVGPDYLTFELRTLVVIIKQK